MKDRCCLLSVGTIQLKAILTSAENQHGIGIVLLKLIVEVLTLFNDEDILLTTTKKRLGLFLQQLLILRLSDRRHRSLVDIENLLLFLGTKTLIEVFFLSRKSVILLFVNNVVAVDTADILIPVVPVERKTCLALLNADTSLTGIVEGHVLVGLVAVGISMEVHHQRIERTDNLTMLDKVGITLAILVEPDTMVGTCGNKGSDKHLRLHKSGRRNILLLFLGFFLLLLLLLSFSLFLLGSGSLLMGFLLLATDLLGFTNRANRHTLGSGLAKILCYKLVEGGLGTILAFLLIKEGSDIIKIKCADLALTIDDGTDSILTSILASGLLEDIRLLDSGTFRHSILGVVNVSEWTLLLLLLLSLWLLNSILLLFFHRCKFFKLWIFVN